jgi:hypothetical protein
MSEDFYLIRELVEPVVLTGCLLPWYIGREQPMWLTKERSKTILLPIFSSKEKLDEAMSWMKPQGRWKIKQIYDGTKFLSSFDDHPEIIVALDPYIIDGKTQFTGIIK